MSSRRILITGVGRGLGLAAVQGIVRSLGGGIQVSSATGVGSVFRILLPVQQGAASPAAVDTAGEPQRLMAESASRAAEQN